MEEETLQQILNRCLRKIVTFEFGGQRCVAWLNITLQHLSSLKVENGLTSEGYVSEQDIELFTKVEKYLKDEGFFES